MSGACPATGLGYCEFSAPKICDGAAGPTTRFNALESLPGKLNITLLAEPMSKFCQL